MDARVREMKFFSRLDREGKILVETVDAGGPGLHSQERQMIISLLKDEYVNGIDSAPGVLDLMVNWSAKGAHDSIVRQQLHNLLLGRSAVELHISHKGRVRLSELEQQLKTGRDRDPTGLCLAKRHLLIDLAIVVLSVDKDSPLSVVFLDMNGLKAINDTHGHRAGDEAIRAYLEAVVVAFGEHGEAYRGEGGDEVVVVLPNTTDARAGKLLETFARQLGKDVLVLGDTSARLTASCGSAGTTDPNEDAAVLLERADKAQYRAKDEARKHAPRKSTIALGDSEVTTYAPEPAV